MDFSVEDLIQFIYYNDKISGSYGAKYIQEVLHCDDADEDLKKTCYISTSRNIIIREMT